MKRTTKIILSVLFILIIAIYGYWSLTKNNFITRAPNEYENFYNNLAQETDIVSICYKIAPNAAPQSLGFNPDGLRIYLLRSRCIMGVAISTKNKNLCKDVKTYTANSQVTGYKTSQAACEQSIDNNDRPFGGQLVGGSIDAKWLMENLGYDDSIVPLEIKGNAGEDPTYYWSLYINTYGKTADFPKDFESRMTRLPSFSS